MQRRGSKMWASLVLVGLPIYVATGCSDKKEDDAAAASCSQPATSSSGTVTATQSVRRNSDNQVIMLTEEGQPVAPAAPADPACITASPAPATDTAAGGGGSGSGGGGEDPVAPDVPVDVTGVSPAEGTINGGTVLTILGAGFDAATTVKVGGVDCTSVQVASATSLQCTSPAHAAGEVTVTVADASSEKAFANGYKYGSGAILSGNSSIAFTEIPMGWGSASGVLTLTNTGDLDATVITAPALTAPFEFLSTNVFPGFYYDASQSCGAVLEPGESCIVNTSFEPTAAGNFTGSIVISYHDGVQTTSKTVSLSGTGVVRGAPAADVGTAGVVSANLTGGGDDIFNDTIYLSDYNMLSVGYSRTNNSADYKLAVRKYSGVGTLVSSFGTAGAFNGPVAGCPNHGNGLKAFEESDGKITIVSECINASVQGRLALIRLTAAGALDTSFDSDGIKILDLIPGFTVNIKDAARDSSGRYYVGGYKDLTGGSWDSFLARLTTAGDLDATFATGGVFTTSQSSTQEVINGIVVASSGAVFATGRASQAEGAWTVFKLTSSGALDSSFSGDGIVDVNISPGSPDVGNSIDMMPDGNVVVAGESNGYMALAKIDAVTGAYDPTFGTAGVVHATAINPAGMTSVTKVKVDDYNNVVALGYSYDTGASRYDYLVARYTTAGALDTVFNSGTGYKTYQLDTVEAKPRSISVDILGRYIIGGYAGTTLPATSANARILVIWN